MPLTPAQYQALIVAEVGDTPDGQVAAQIAALWEVAGAQPSDVLRYLYTKRAAIDLLMGAVRQQVSFKALDGASVDLSDLMEHLTTMREATQQRIDEAIATLDAGGAIAEITTTAPIAPPPNWPDANAERLRGSPYWPNPRAPGRWPT